MLLQNTIHYFTLLPLLGHLWTAMLFLFSNILPVAHEVDLVTLGFRAIYANLLKFLVCIYCLLRNLKCQENMNYWLWNAVPLSLPSIPCSCNMSRFVVISL